MNKDGIGIPHVIFETTAPGESQKEKLLSMTTLPTPEEVLQKSEHTMPILTGQKTCRIRQFARGEIPAKCPEKCPEKSLIFKLNKAYGRCLSFSLFRKY